MARTVAGILLPIAVGMPFVLWLQSWLTRLAMAFLAGIVVITAGLTLIGVAGLHFTALSVAPLAAVWLVAAAFAVRRTWKSVSLRPKWPQDWGRPAWILLGIATLNVASAAAYAVRTPIADTDVVVIWLPKGVLTATEGFKALARSVYPDYPPLWPLHIYLANGGGVWIKLLPSAYLVATLLLVFDFVRSRVGPVVAAACVLAVSGVPYIWLPYGVNDLMSEVPMMAFVTASTIMLAEYVRQPSPARAAVTALAAAGTVLVRPEGFFHAFLIGAILVIAGYRLRRLRETLLAAAAIFVVYIGWRVVVRFVFHYSGGLGPNPSALTPSFVASALADTSRYAAANIGNPYLFGPALIAVAFVALAITRWRLFGIVVVVLAADVVVGTATYLALPSTNVGEPLIWWLTTGYKRMLMHDTPLLYVTAALAAGYLLTRRASPTSETPARRLLDWGTRLAPALAVIALTATAIVVAGYAAYQVGGPKAYDLSDMGPSHIAGTTADYSTPGTIALSTTNGNPARLIFYLQVTGRRLPPLDNISGTFGRFSATVEAPGSGAPSERFTVSVDGKQIAAATATSGSGPVTLDGSLPLGGRFLELDVTQLDPGTGTASWIRPTVYRITAWWAADAFLAVALGLLAGSALVAGGVVPRPDQRVLRVLTPSAVAVTLLGAAAVQQAEAIAEVALPIWSGALRVVGFR